MGFHDIFKGCAVGDVALKAFYVAGELRNKGFREPVRVHRPEMLRSASWQQFGTRLLFPRTVTSRRRQRQPCMQTRQPERADSG